MRAVRFLAVATGWAALLAVITAGCFVVTAGLFLGWGPEDFPVGFAFLVVAGHLVVRHARRARWAGRSKPIEVAA